MTVHNADDERDRLAEEWLVARHGRDWYIGSATRTEWEMAYKHVDAALAEEATDA